MMAPFFKIFSRRGLQLRNLKIRYDRLNQTYGTLASKNNVLLAMFAPFGVYSVYHLGKELFFQDMIGTYWHELARKNVGVPFPDETIDVITEEMGKCEDIWPSKDDPRRRMGAVDRCHYKFCISNDFDTHTLGYVYNIARAGAMIFFPYYLTYDKPSDVDRDFPKLNLFKKHMFDWSEEFKINWSNKFAEKLRNSLVLSSNAKSYIIRRELRKANENDLMMQTSILLFPNFCAAGIYECLYRLNEKVRLRFYQKHCLAIAIVLTLAGAKVRNVAKNIHDVMFEKSCDLIPIRSENYKSGAVEYFAKSIERNKILREMLGDRGRQLFDADGNDLSHLKYLPLTMRLANVKKCNIEEQLLKPTTSDNYF